MNDLFIVTLTKGHVAIVDADDAPLVAGRKWAAWSPYKGKVYARHRKGSQCLYMHRHIANPAPGEVVDHLDHNGTNNTRENLRVCSVRENVVRTKGLSANNTSGYKGVYWERHAKRWRARIVVDRKPVHIGYYDTREEAARARDRAAVAAHGEMPYLNFPGGSSGDG